MTYFSYNNILKMLLIKTSPTALTMLGRLPPCSCYLLNLTQPIFHLSSGSASFYSLTISWLSSTTPFSLCCHLSPPFSMKHASSQHHSSPNPTLSGHPSLTPSYNRYRKPNFVFKGEFVITQTECISEKSVLLMQVVVNKLVLNI